MPVCVDALCTYMVNTHYPVRGWIRIAWILSLFNNYFRMEYHGVGFDNGNVNKIYPCHGLKMQIFLKRHCCNYL